MNICYFLFFHSQFHLINAVGISRMKFGIWNILRYTKYSFRNKFYLFKVLGFLRWINVEVEFLRFELFASKETLSYFCGRSCNAITKMVIFFCYTLVGKIYSLNLQLKICMPTKLGFRNEISEPSHFCRRFILDIWYYCIFK